jgi:hypothetical protein
MTHTRLSKRVRGCSVGLLAAIELSLDPSTFSQSRPTRPKRMERRRDRRPGSRSARAPRRSHWFSYCRARPQSSPEGGFRASRWACASLLATNAGKYGALSTDPGRVNVRWRTEGNTFTMSWIGSDGPLVSAPERRGFGSMIMEEMAEHGVDVVDLIMLPQA